MAPLSALVVLLASFAAGDVPPPPARGTLSDSASLGQAAAVTPSDAKAKDAAGAPFDGNAPSGAVVSEDGRRTIQRDAVLTPSTGQTAAAAGPNVPTPPAKDAPHKLTSAMVLGGAAVLGGLQGWFAAGLVGAAAGAGLGLAAAWLFEKKDYGAAFGLTAGAIIGTAFGGPIGGLIGAAVGGLVGHFLGKLFL